jgi:hypothetical protein
MTNPGQGKASRITPLPTMTPKKGKEAKKNPSEAQIRMTARKPGGMYLSIVYTPQNFIGH